MIEGMLHRENKLLIISFLLISFFVSCNRYKKYNKKEINSIREESVNISQSIIGYDEYWKIYDDINDSINVWKTNKLGYYKHFGISKGYMVDSVMCINSTKNKLITTILFQQLLQTGVQDDIWYFYGIKIGGEWYFFSGPTLVLPRKYYQKDIHTPLSFEKLKQIATSNIYRRYLVENKKGEWEINDRFFSDLTSVAWCSNCVTQEQWDSAYIRHINMNWSKRDKR